MKKILSFTFLLLCILSGVNVQGEPQNLNHNGEPIRSYTLDDLKFDDKKDVPYGWSVAVEQQFQNWYAEQAAKYNLNQDPDYSGHHYNFRKIFWAKAAMDKTGRWPFQFLKEKNPIVAVECDLDEVSQKAAQGDAVAQFNLGTLYYEGKAVPKNDQDAFSWIKKAAEQGLAVAQFCVAYMYFNGKGIQTNYERAVFWLKKAAEQGNAVAQAALGELYNDGLEEIGITKDFKQAVYWYQKAAEQGVADAQFNLGHMYYLGNGVTQDREQAKYWYQKAAAQGAGDARKFFELLPSAEQGNVDSQRSLCILSTNDEVSSYWYLKAAEQGDVSAQYIVAGFYNVGCGILKKDYKQAAYWCLKAAEQGHVAAQNDLGYYYYNGKGVPQNYKLSYVWFSLSAVRGPYADSASHNRDVVAQKLTPQQLAEAQALAARIQYQIDHPSESQGSDALGPSNQQNFLGSGTGFFITSDGYILTCHHVVKGAGEIKVAVDDAIYPATLVLDNPKDDLALLKIDNGSFSALSFSSKRSAKMGQDVFTIGYPNPSLQGVNAKYTKGTVSSLTGFQDDLRLYQVSVPVQPGNSGGALLDEYGNVLGVMVAMLDAKQTFNISGSLPQNVNYAVKSIYARAMLDTKPEISEKLAEPSTSNANAVDRAKKSTVLILCYE